MAKIFVPKTFAEFKDTNKQFVNDKMQLIIENKNKEIKTSFLFLITAIVLISLGIIFWISGSLCLFLISSSKSIYWTGYLQIALFLASIFTGTILLISFLRKQKSIVTNIDKDLNEEDIYKQIFNQINYKIVESEYLENVSEQEEKNSLSKELKKKSEIEERKELTKKINDILINEVPFNWLNNFPDGSWVSKSAFIEEKTDSKGIIDNLKNHWNITSAKFSWVSNPIDKMSSIREKDKSQWIIFFETKLKKFSESSNKNFSFSFGKRSGINKLFKNNIGFENKKFNDIFSPYSNDKIKAIKFYGPYAMEVSVNHFEQYFDKNKDFGLFLKRDLIRGWVKRNTKILELNLPKYIIKKQDFIDKVVNNLLDQIYLVYWFISMVQISNYS